jgi:hypothetical protein
MLGKVGKIYFAQRLKGINHREIAFTLMVEASGFLSKNNVVKLL